ncbi:MAG: hypothetical protein EOS26_08005 [Mesorhizobium sp.]|nr:MAG: hypothetical protein EOS26_08005 [Mesorhizobium sp.]
MASSSLPPVADLLGCGIHLDRGTLGGWVGRAAWWLSPLYDRLLAFIRSQPRVFCDETPLPRLDPGRKRTKVCQLWAQAVDDRAWQGPAPPAVGYVFAESRGTGEIETQLSTSGGILQVDAMRPTRAWRSGGARAISHPCSLPFVWPMLGASSSRWSRRRARARRWR